MNQAQALYHLQSFDHRISQIRTRLAAIDQLLGENTRVLAAEQTATSAEEAISPWRTRIKDLELEISSIVAKVNAVEQRLYGGKVSNPKELKDMQDEIDSLKRRRVKLEDDLLEAMISVESGQSSLVDARAELETVRAEWGADQSNLGAERAELQADLEALRAERGHLTAEIEPENLELYKRLFRSKNGQPVTRLLDTNCGACGVSQTTSAVQHIRQARELVFCSNCGRILTLP